MVFLEEFKKFEDKSSAISESGISPQLATMIKKWVRDGQKLAVGKIEYKTIIENKLVSVLVCLSLYSLIMSTSRLMSTAFVVDFSGNTLSV